eukprot:11072420-Karenia_brevis.AAC.1
MHSIVILTPDPTPRVVASPFIVPSNTEPEPEEEDRDEIKDESMKDEVKDESGGALEPSAPPKPMTTNPMSS